MDFRKAMGWTPPPSTASLCQSGSVCNHLRRMGASAMNVTAVGIDLAKNVLQVHGVEARGKAVLRRQLRREQVTAFFAQLPPCLIGMEACASAHHWGRTLQRFGHTVRLMAPQFVKPYLKTNKNDMADAEAICEAVTPTEYALRADQEHRAAGSTIAAPRTARVRQGSHGAGEPDPRL